MTRWRRRGIAAAVPEPMASPRPAFGAARLLAGALGVLVAIQWGITATHLFVVVAAGETSAMGLALAAVMLTLSAVLLQAVGELRGGQVVRAALNSIAPALLVAAAHHSAGDPFSEDQLPWLLLAATALVALSVVHLALARCGRGSQD